MAGVARDPEKRGLLIAGGAFFGILLALIALVALVAGDEGDEKETTVSTVACAPDDAACRAAQQAGERPGIIPTPGEGRAPEDAGEPGGAAQIALFFGLVAALGVIIALVVRSTRRSAGRRTPDPDAEAQPVSR